VRDPGLWPIYLVVTLDVAELVLKLLRHVLFVERENENYNSSSFSQPTLPLLNNGRRNRKRRKSR
jgi:hypothetical protein